METIPDVDEAEAVVGLLDGAGVPAWLSYTIEGERARAGQPLTAAFDVASAAVEVVAVGVNCCAPPDVLPAVEVARAVGRTPVVVYPNSGETWEARARSWTGDPAPLDDLAAAWVEAGASVVGGCCRVTPAQIADMRAAVGTPRG